MTDQKHMKELEAFEDTMKERWDQLKSYFDHPMLDKPLALPDDCDKCHVNLKLFFNDCKKHMAFQLTAVTKQRDEAIKLCSDLIAENAGLKNSRDELREACSVLHDIKWQLENSNMDLSDISQFTDEIYHACDVLTKTKESV